MPRFHEDNYPEGATIVMNDALIKEGYVIYYLNRDFKVETYLVDHKRYFIPGFWVSKLRVLQEMSYEELLFRFIKNACLDPNIEEIRLLTQGYNQFFLCSISHQDPDD